MEVKKVVGEDRIEATVKELMELLSKSQSESYIGEPITQLEHALQCAYFASDLSATSSYREDKILAALFHDIGHLCAPKDAPQMDHLGVIHHELIGAHYLLEKGFSTRVAQLVQGHVEAKRYLVTRNAQYRSKLSSASGRTLDFQGGAMSEEEAQNFESDPLFQEKLQIRSWDEMGKIPNLTVPDLESYRELVFHHLIQQL